MENILKSKRFLIALGIALVLLAGAVWLNIKLDQDREGSLDAEQGESSFVDEESKQTMVNVYGDYFNAFRDDRSAVRAQEIDYLRSIINSENSDEETLLDAQERLLTLVGNMEKEFTIESRIRSKGFIDAAATMQGETVTVVIDGEKLTEEEVARILDIVISETGLPASAVKISLGSHK